MDVRVFVFNDFQENTYVIFDESKECIIVDPGCNNVSEREELTAFIDQNGLKPVMVINTHCHIDHVLGNKYVCDYYKLALYAHEIEKKMLEMQPSVASYYGIYYDPSPEVTGILTEGSTISFGQTTLEILFVPGHSPGHICLYNEKSGKLLAGDALFKESIGRTDLPGGDYDTLISKITSELFNLPEHTIVYPGHGQPTSIGHEKMYNPFFKGV